MLFSLKCYDMYCSTNDSSAIFCLVPLLLCHLCAKECPVEEELVKIKGFWAADIVFLNSLEKPF